VIALDTNVLLRLVVADDPEQTKRAASLLARAGEAADPLFVPDIVLCELAWVLSRTFGFPRAGIAQTMRGLLESAELAFRDATAVSAAAAAHARGDGDFADHLIAATAQAAGCEAVATFDKTLHGQPGFVAV
jgi:predicted nucleic-acid-binding protein